MYLCVNPVSTCNKLTGLRRVLGFGLNVPGPQGSGTMSAKKTGAIGPSGSRCLSSQDAKARVKRVSIEGNIGKIINISSLFIGLNQVYFIHFSYTVRLWFSFKPLIMYHICVLNQLLASQLLPGSCSQRVQTGRWWQNLSANGRTLRAAPRRFDSLQNCTSRPNNKQRQHLCVFLWQGTVASPQATVSNLLQMMYQDPQRWSYTFQTYSCMSRFRTQLQPPAARLIRSKGRPVQVYERSVYSDRWLSAHKQKNEIMKGEL